MKIRYVFLLILFSYWCLGTNAATRTARVSGNWNSTVTWGGSAIPTSSDAVIINGGVTVTVNVTAACSSISFANSTSSTLTISGSNTLTVSGGITIKRPSTSSNTNTLAIGAGTLSCTSIALQGTTGTRYTAVTISTGTLTVNGNITSAGICSQITFSGTGRLNVSGTFMSGTAGTFTASTGTVNFSGSAQTISPFAYTFYNVILSGSGVKTMTNSTINGMLSLQGTTTTGGSSPNYGTSSRIRYNRTSALTTGIEWGNDFPGSDIIIANSGVITLNEDKILNTNLTINSGATLSTAGYNLTINQNFTNNGTLNCGSSAIIINGTGSQSIGSFSTTGNVIMSKSSGVATLTGDITASSLTISGSSGTLNLGNNKNHSITDLTLSQGTLNSSTSTLSISGNITGTTGFNKESGTVIYNGNAQSIAVLNYNNLILSGTGVKTMSAQLNISGNLQLSGTASINASNIINVGGDLEIGAGTSFNAGTYTHNIGGNFTNNGGTFVCSSSTINFNGVSIQTIKSNNYPFNNITVSNTTMPVGLQLADNMTINGSYNQTVDGILFLSNYDLTFGVDAINNIISASSLRMIAADVTYGSGKVKKTFSGGSSTFTYPIGVYTGSTLLYSPVTLNMTTNSKERTIGINIKDEQHPNLPNPLPSDYLSRYWNITENSGGGTYNYNISINYSTDNIFGSNESNLLPQILEGTNWNSCGGSVNTGTKNIEFSGNESENSLLNAVVTGFYCIKPTISILPNNPLTQCPGNNFVFTTTSTGNNLSYAWYKNGVNISGQTGSGLSINNMSGADAGTYICISSNSCGTATSNSATIKLYNEIVTNISGGASTICYNTNPGTLTINATGGTGSYTYQWYRSPSQVISGATGVTYNPGNLTGNAGYFCKVSSGVCEVSSAVFNITVYGNLSANITGGTSTICYNNNPGTLAANVTGGSGTYTYQWYTSSSNPISGATQSTYNPGNLTVTSGFYCVAGNGSCGSITTSTKTITVYANFTPGIIGNPQTICYNTIPQTLTFTTNPTGGTGSYTYQWYKSPSTLLTGATTSNYTPAALTSGASYYCRVMSGSCETINSNTVSITINPLPQGILSSINPYCSGTNGKLILTTTSGTGSFSVVYNDGTSNRNATGLTSGEAFNVYENPTSTTNYTLISITDANNCTRTGGFTDGTATLTYIPSPTVSLVSNPSTLCNGSSALLTATNTGGTVGMVTGSNTSGISGSGTDPQSISRSITLAGGKLRSLSDITLTINATHTWSGELTATLTGPCGSTTIFNNPGGTGFGDDLIGTGNYIFKRSSSNTFPKSDGAGSVPTGTYYASFSGLNLYPTCTDISGTWTLTLSTATGGHNRVITLNSWSITINNANVYTTVIEGPGSIGGINYSGNNNSTATCTVTPSTNGSNTYTVTTTDAAGCMSSTSTNVTVNSLPSNRSITGNATICAGGSRNIIVSNSETGVNYQLRKNSDNSNIGSPVAGNGGDINLPSGNLNTTTTFNVLATRITTSCTRQLAGTITINVNPLPGDNAGTDKTICSNESTVLGRASVSGRTYSWTPTNGLSDSNISEPTANPLISTTYTLTETIIATGCSSANQVKVTVNPIPVISINQNYCAVGGKVQLTSNPFTSYLWSTGETTQSILVDQAGIYTITATNSYGCSNINAATVAVELVVNGNFSQGNTGFISEYTNQQAPYTGGSTGLVPEGLYAIGNNAHDYHSNFFGTDHTQPGVGNFMIVNGFPNKTTAIVWSQIITIRPYTTYYFSAFAMSLNNVSPYAKLQFAVNGQQVGTVDELTSGASSPSGPFNWTRFYATWTSGATTTAVLSIVDLNPALGGNDFGLDDISCSTLSPIGFSASPDGAGSTICEGDNFRINSNVKGITKPYTYQWSGPNSYTSTDSNLVFTSATSGMSGVYNLTVTDSQSCSIKGSTSVIINPIPTVSSNISSGSICNWSSINLTSSANTYNNILLYESFNEFINNWTCINNSTGGTPAKAKWELMPSGFTYTGTSTTFTTNDATQFYLSNSHSQGSGGTTSTILQSPVMSTIGYTSLSLDFYHYFRYKSGENGKVEVSTNGTSWTTVATYYSTQGTSTNFSHPTINLNAYIGNSTFYIRFRYSATYDYFWAIDNVTLSGQYSIYNYNWSSIPEGFSSTQQNVSAVLPTVSTTYTVNYQIPANGCNNNSSASVVVNYPPVITSQPESKNICDNIGNVDFSVTATGTALSYKWQEYRTGWTDINDDSKYSGSRTGYLNILNPTFSMNGYKYRCIVSGTCSPTVTSNEAVLTVYQRPTASISGTTEICYGGSTNLSFNFSGVQPFDLTYTDGTSTFTLNGITTTSTVIAVSPTSTKSYSIVSMNDANCSARETDISGIANIVVHNLLTPGVISNNQTICYNTTATALTFSNLPTGGTGSYTYQWYKSSVLIPGATNTIYNPGQLTTSSSYYCAVSSGVCGTQNSNTINVTVYPIFNAGAISSSQNICYNSNPTQLFFNTTPSGANNIYTYQWYNNSGIITSATNSLYSPPALTSNNTYRCRVSSSTCGALTTNAVTINVYNQLSATISGGNTEICFNSNPGTMNVMANGGNGVYTYSWYKNSMQINGASTSNYNPGNLTSENSYHCVVSNGTCGTVSTAVKTIEVLNRPTANINGNAKICQGGSADLSISLTGRSPWNLTYTDGSETMNLTNITTSNFTINVSPTVSRTYTIVSVSDGLCEALESDINGSATIEVNGVLNAEISGGDTLVCFNYSVGTLTANVTGGPNSYNYQWYKNGSLINNATNSTYITENIIEYTSFYCQVSALGCNTVNTADVNIKITGDKTHGLWTGCKNSHWEDNLNWSDGIVPGINSDVIIPTNSKNQPVVYSSASAICRNITIQKSASLTINKNAVININKDIRIESTPNAVVNNSGIINLSGNFYNESDGSTGTGEIIIKGNIAQEVYGKMESGKLTMSTTSSLNNSGTIIITSELKLNKGIINTTKEHILIMNESAYLPTQSSVNTGASDISYINGPMIKKCNSAFTFPIGKSSATYPLNCIRFEPAETNNIILFAEYIDKNPPYSDTLEMSLKKLNKSGYWVFKRIEGSCNGKVSLYWRDLSVPYTGHLRVASLDTNDVLYWKNRGNTSVTGKIGMNSSGMVKSDIINEYELFAIAASTLGSIKITPENPFICPGKPITFIANSATVLPNSYQWYKEGILIPGATNSTLIFETLTEDDYNKTYHCEGYNNWGVHKSNSSKLTLITEPTVDISPLNVNICPGGIVEFKAEVNSPVAVNYQWYRQVIELKTAKKSTYRLENISLKDASTYYCVVTNECGVSVSSQTASIVVNNFVIRNHPADVTTHLNGNAFFTVIVSDTINTTYKWQQRLIGYPYTISEISDNEIFSNSGTAKLGLRNIPISLNKVFYRCIVTNTVCGKELTSNWATLNVGQIIPGQWIGVTNDKWEVGSNWDTGYEPDTLTDVIIPGNVPYYPVIRANKTGHCKSVTIKPGGALTVKNNGRLNVKEFVHIKSDATGTGAFLNEQYAIINRVPATIERYIEKNGYHYLSTAMRNKTLADINKFVPLVNLTGKYFDPKKTPPVNLFPNIWKMDETHSDPNNPTDQAAWLAPSSLSEPIELMRGYSVLFPKHNTMVKYTGYTDEFVSGNVSYNLTHGGNGFNFIANPYSSPIDMDLLTNNLPQNVSKTVFLFYSTSYWYGTWGYYNKDVGAYGAYPQGKYIPAMQGFYVHTDEPKTITFTDEMRTVVKPAINTVFFKTTNRYNKEFPIIKLSCAEISTPDNRDETVIYFKESAKMDFDDNDFRKFKNSAPEYPDIYTLSDTSSLSLNSLPEITDGLEIPLVIKAKNEGKHTLKVEKIMNFNSDINIYLRDNYKNELYNLKVNPELEFNIESDDKADRFVILFNILGMKEDKQVDERKYEFLIYPNPSDGQNINIQLKRK